MLKIGATIKSAAGRQSGIRDFCTPGSGGCEHRRKAKDRVQYWGNNIYWFLMTENSAVL
jgi:hypothetical protein